MSSTTVLQLPVLEAGDYLVDPDRSTVSFTTRHMFGLGGVAGTFRIREALLVVGDPVHTTTLHAVLDATSFTTASAKRDVHVNSAKFLDTAVYPDITVVGTSIGQRNGRWVAEGTVNAHGVSAPLELVLTDLEHEKTGDLRVHATARIDRYAHGVTAAKGMAGRWLDVTLEAVARR